MPDSDAYMRDIVATACRLPIDYYLFGNESASELLRRSGYPSVRSRFGVDMVVDCLADHADWVDAWFHWSEDTRGTPAWFVQERDGQYIVGYYDSRPTKPPLVFTDRVRACAEYVHRTLELIAGGKARA